MSKYIVLLAAAVALASFFDASAFHKSATSVTTAEVSSGEFNRDLYFGLRRDPDVMRLQDFLRKQAFFTYPESTGNFFTITLEAVAAFQRAHGIRPAAGYFGPLTRAKANQISSAKPPPPAPPPLSVSNEPSAYKGKITFSSLRGTSINPGDEIIELVNRTKAETIVLTDWTLITSQGKSFQIPRVYNLPGLQTSSLDFLRLPPGGKAVISVGKQERRLDFQENLCTGYFDQFSTFRPSLAHRCPKPDTRPLTQFNDACIKAIERVSACRIPSSSEFFGIDSDCSRYLNENLSYVGCVKNYRSRPDFYGNRWFIWMQLENEFLRNTHDTVTLRDTFGKIVDEKSY